MLTYSTCRPRGKRHALALATVLACSIAQAQISNTPNNIEAQATEQARRAAEREAQLRAIQEKTPDVKLTAPGARPTPRIPDESPCFQIDHVILDTGSFQGFPALANYMDGRATPDLHDSPVGRCLGAQGIQIVMDRLQNALIAQGYVTSKVVAAPQSLQNGTLALTVQWGTIRQVQWAPVAPDEIQRASQWNTLPMGPGDVLNLRDVEQALENFKRVPTAQADVQIQPGRDPGTSDLVIRHSQPFPFRLNLSADDSGTPSTGKFQGNATFSYDNWLTLSDLFYVSLNHDLGGSDAGSRGTQGRTVHYSVPYGYWTLAMTASNNRYHQTVAGATQDYVYSGTSQNIEAKLSRIVHRDSVGKTSVSLKGFQRKSNNYVDDTEVEVQRRTVGGLELGLNHKRAMGQATVEGNISYKRGTGAWGTQAAPEEAFGEGTSRMQLWLADANVSVPMTLGHSSWTYSGSWRAQFNRTPLTPQDRMAIAGRYSVRGFDGLNILSAERGWVLRNEMATPIQANTQLYVGIDHGQVNGPSAASLVGNRLTGGVLGVRGQAQKFQYDVFIGSPIQKPDHFKTASITAGFSVSVSF